MSKGLKRKLEDAFKAYITSKVTTGTSLVGVPIYGGRGELSDRVLPAVTVFVTQLQLRDGMPSNCGEYLATISFHNASQLDDQAGSATNHDARQYQLEGIIKDTASAKAFINKPVGTDNRTVKGIYIYDIYNDDERHDFGLSSDRTLDDTITFIVPCRNDNGDGT